MSGVNEENVYARTAILQWATEILHGNYGSFADIPAKDIAVLLYVIFNGTAKGSSTESRTADVVSLHDIQFCDNPTSMTCFLNAKRVLSLVQTLSSTSGEGGDFTEIGGNSSRRVAPSAVGNMTVSAWMEGKAFVEELKMWRWIRAQAFRRELSTRELECRAQAILCGTAGDSVEPPSELPAPAKAVTTESTQAESAREAIRPIKRVREEDNEAPCVADTPTAALGAKNNAWQSSAAAAKRGGAGENGGGETSSVLCQPAVDVPKGEKEEQTELLPYLTCDGALVAPRLLGVLEEVKKELEERKSAAECVDNGGIATCSLAACGGESRAHDEARGSGHSFNGCSSCPAIFAEVVRQNYSAIERLETVRKMAIAACLKKDTVGLLEALAYI